MIKNFLHTILSVFLHPVAILVYFTYIMLTHSTLAFFLIDPNFGRSFFSYVILMSVIFPVILLFVARLHKRNYILSFKKENSRTLLIFAVYFVLIAIFAHTQIALLSVLQQLPAVLAVILLIFNELAETNSHIATISSFATTLILLSILLNINFLTIILVTIILLGVFLFLLFEKELVSLKTTLVSVGTGVVSTCLYFLILYLL